MPAMQLQIMTELATDNTIQGKMFMMIILVLGSRSLSSSLLMLTKALLAAKDRDMRDTNKEQSWVTDVIFPVEVIITILRVAMQQNSQGDKFYSCTKEKLNLEILALGSYVPPF